MRKKIIFGIPGILLGSLLVIYLFFPALILQSLVKYERSRAGLVLKKLTVQDHDLAYLSNDPDGALAHKPSIVFIHGFAADKDNWTRMARFFKNDFRVFAIDQPGFGESSRIPTHIYSLPNQVDYIHQALEILGVSAPGKKYHLAGNSMGGNIVGLYGMRYPKEVASMAFFNPGGIKSAKKSIYQKTLQETGRNILLVDSVADFDRLIGLTMTKPPYIPGPIKEYFAERALLNRKFNDKIYTDAFVNNHHQLEDVLSQIRAPSLILWGDDDRVLDVSGAKIMQNKMTAAKTKTVIMKNCGHAPMIERPAETARHYMDFLSELADLQ